MKTIAYYLSGGKTGLRKGVSYHFCDFRTSSALHTDEWHNYCEWDEMAQSRRWLWVRWVACTPVSGSRWAPCIPGVTTGKKCSVPDRSGTQISSSYSLQRSYYAWATHLTSVFLAVCEFPLFRYNSKLLSSVCSHCLIFYNLEIPFLTSSFKLYVHY